MDVRRVQNRFGDDSLDAPANFFFLRAADAILK
jgi:hypothetical protein